MSSSQSLPTPVDAINKALATGPSISKHVYAILSRNASRHVGDYGLQRATANSRAIAALCELLESKGILTESEIYNAIDEPNGRGGY